MRNTHHKFDIFFLIYTIMLGGCVYHLFSVLEGGALIIGVKAGETLSYQAAWLLLYLGLIFKIIQRRRVVFPILLKSNLLIAFFISCLLSFMVNGTDPDSLFKFGMYLMTIAFAAWLVAAYPLDRFIESFYQIGILALIVYVLAYPVSGGTDWDFGRTTIFGTSPYGGLFSNKNIAGVFFGISTIVCIVKYISLAHTNRYLCLFSIAFNLLALGLTGSVGALVSVFIASCLAILLHFMVARKYHFVISFLILFAFIVPLFTVYNLSSIFEFAGRDEGLTGRSGLWAAWPTFFFERPLLGYGFNGFFNNLSDGPVAQLWQLGRGYKAISFDNAYLEIGIQFGLIGGLIYGLILIKGVLTALRFSFSSNSLFKVGPFALICFVLCSSIIDDSMTLHNSICCVVVFWVYFGIETSKASVNMHASKSSSLGEGWRGTPTMVTTSIARVEP